MARLALILHENGEVAPLDDNTNPLERVAVYDIGEKVVSRVDQPYDSGATDFDLAEFAVIEHVTDVIAQHFEDEVFEKLQSRGIHMWLEAPGMNASGAIEAWREAVLPEAVVGAHAIHDPHGRRVRKQSARERQNHRHSPSPARGVSPPAHGPVI